MTNTTEQERSEFEKAYREVYSYRGDKENDYYLRRNSLHPENYYELCAVNGWKLWQAHAELIRQRDSGQGEVLLSESEQKDLLQNPYAIAQIINYHELQIIQAESIGKPCEWSGNENRITELKAKAINIMSEDLDCWTDEIKREFGLKVDSIAQPQSVKDAYEKAAKICKDKADYCDRKQDEFLNKDNKVSAEFGLQWSVATWLESQIRALITDTQEKG